MKRKKIMIFVGGGICLLGMIIFLAIVIFKQCSEPTELMSPVYNQNEKVVNYDIITMGEYGGEKLKWRVLEVKENQVFLVLDSLLKDSEGKVITKRYNDDSEKGATWENCSLRQWLNHEFYNDAFTESEKKGIIETEVFIRDYGEEKCKDLVYCLSMGESLDDRYGLYYYQNATRKLGEGYWLRTTPYISDIEEYDAEAHYIDEYGMCGLLFQEKQTVELAIRPCIHIDKEKAEWTYEEKISKKVEYIDLPVSHKKVGISSDVEVYDDESIEGVLKSALDSIEGITETKIVSSGESIVFEKCNYEKDAVTANIDLFFDIDGEEYVADLFGSDSSEDSGEEFWSVKSVRSTKNGRYYYIEESYKETQDIYNIATHEIVSKKSKTMREYEIERQKSSDESRKKVEDLSSQIEDKYGISLGD